MAFIDEIHIHASAGKGGDGVVRWRHEKSKEYGGPSGGDGGKGGSVYARAVRDVSVLSRYRSVKEFKAENGGNGGSDDMHGKNGADFIVDVPIGSVITNKNTDERFELLKEGEKILLLAGGVGGFGNTRFKGSTNQQPTEFTVGALGEEGDIQIELQLIADAGLIGLPNAGKSSLLNELTRAHARVGSYAFTTLEPNLGVMHGFILADIPGLIEGAAEGKGLGHKFLKHVKRTRVLLHCISLENEDLEHAYRTVRTEAGNYDPLLLKKIEVILLTKTDSVDAHILEKAFAWAKKLQEHVYGVSVYDDASLKNLSDGLTKILGSFKE